VISVTSGMPQRSTRHEKSCQARIARVYEVSCITYDCTICTTYAILASMTIDSGSARWVPSTSTFGARLALVRQRMKWNIKEAALACSVAQASWREWELQNRQPHKLQEVSAKIADRTGVDDYWLMTGRETPLPPPPGGGLPLPRVDSNHQPSGCGDDDSATEHDLEYPAAS
jgi:hypothetical protein